MKKSEECCRFFREELKIIHQRFFYIWFHLFQSWLKWVKNIYYKQEVRDINQKKKISLKPELQKFIENIAAIYEGYGIPRIGGRIFGLSLVFGEPLLAEDMSGLLQASRSSISTNIRAFVSNDFNEALSCIWSDSTAISSKVKLTNRYIVFLTSLLFCKTN